MRFVPQLVVSLALLGSLTCFGQDFEDRIAAQRIFAQQMIHTAVSPVGGAAGSVMASPSRSQPNYFYHWVRDGSIAARVLVNELDDELKSGNTSAARLTQSQLLDFARFSLQNQATPNKSGEAWDQGLGEPKFNLDGSAYTESWGRPQTDGPALRALAMMEFAAILERTGQQSTISELLYRTEMPARSLIKADLEFVAHHWRDPSFDLWEERMGDHFFTRMAQWSALTHGAEFARHMRDLEASSFYSAQASAILTTLGTFWNSGAGYIVATQNQRLTRLAITAKPSNLDIAVVLGVLVVGKEKGDFSVTDERVYRTVERLEATFDTLYLVNAQRTDATGDALAPGIGRYPEDRYDGYRTDSLGNPWFLATQAMAEYHYRLARAVENGAALPTGDPSNSVRAPHHKGAHSLLRNSMSTREIAQAIRDKGDSYLRRAFRHTDSRGHQSEQFNRESGYMQGAVDLTWSYASFLTAIQQR